MVVDLSTRPPVRLDNGPWTISVAESPYDQHSYSLYVKNPTHNLTLTRTTKDILDLNHRLRESHPAADIPPLPAGFAAHRPTPKRKSNFLNTLSRFASPAAKRTAHTSAPPSSYATPVVSPTHEANDPFASFGDDVESSGTSAARSESSPGSGAAALTQPASSISTALAAYFTKISNSPTLCQARVWKRFVRVRTDDLESVRVERAIKRVRSDLAAHVGGSPKTPTSAAGAEIEEKEKGGVEDKENMAPPGADTASIRSQAAPVLGKPVDQRSSVAESEKDVVFTSPIASEVEPVSGTSASDPVATADPQHEARDKGTTPEPAAAEEQEASTPTTASDPSRMHRSQSADPDKSSRLNRVYAVGDMPPARDQTLSQTGSETSASTGTGAESHSHSRSAKKKRSGSAERSGSNKELSKKLSTRKVVVDDFEMMRVLGKGCAGKVLLVRHKNSGDMFAMKAITKRHVLAHQELQHTLTEQAVLKKMAHAGEDPFVVKLWWSFHDKENLFLVMDFHPGGDLATQLARWGRLGRDRARFYAAEIVEGCEGLHANGVIYRDLKPENILIGSDGHIVLTDFGLSKEFARTPPSANTAPTTPSGTRTNGFYSSSASQTTSAASVPVTPPWMKAPTEKAGDIALGWPAPSTATDSTSTFCGTAEYLAPEVIQGLPYSYQVDWWSFGTMLFEMLTGITPFWANNHSDMYLRVLQDELQFPDDRAMDPDTKSLIRGLLQRNPALRMSEPRIKRHPYFSMIDWTHVYYKRYIPPYIPPIDPANASDTQNFDDTFLGMEPVLDDPNDVQTDTDQERGENTDTDRTDGEDTNTPSQSRSSSVTPADEDVEDVFDGYSFKGRHSVIIDDDDDDDVTSEESGPGSEDDEDKDIAGVRDADIENLRDETDGRKEGHVSPSPTPDEADATEPKTPEARPHALPAESEPEPAPVPAPAPARKSPSPPPKAEVPQQVSPKARRSKDLPPPSSPVLSEPKPRRSKDLPPARFTEDLPVTPAKDTRPAARQQRNARQKREKSGVPALDKYLSDAVDEDEDGTGKGLLDDEDDDWDFVEAVEGEERNGARGTSLFARGVVDRYKLAVFRKPTPSQPMRSFSGMSTKTNETIPAESPESTRKRGKATMGFKTPRQFLQPKSPSSNKSSLTGTGGSGSVGSRAGAASTSASLSSTTKSSRRMESSTSATLSAASSASTSQGMLMTPSTTGSVAEQPPRLKNKESEMSMGVESISSDPEHGRGALTDTGAMTDGGKTKDGKPKKKLKRYKQNAEKMFNLFSSPRP